MGQTIILLATLICLLSALILNWGRPARKSAGTFTIDLECDAEPALAELRKVSAALECIAKQQEGVSQVMRLEVKDAGRGANVNPAPTYARPPAPPSPPKAPRTAKRRSR